MTANSTGDRAAIRRLFAHIACHYDRMNRLMTLGQDRRWRRELLRRASLAPGSRLLDLGAGTGELARQAMLLQPDVWVVAVDITPEMIRLGRARLAGQPVAWVVADARHLPFPAAAFDAVASAFLLRNVTGLDVALHEQTRVLRPGRKLVALDTSPAEVWSWPLVRFYLSRLVPALAQVVTGDAPAYNYLAASTEGFLSAQELAAHLREAGLHRVGFVRRSFGAVAIHWGCRQ